MLTLFTEDWERKFRRSLRRIFGSAYGIAMDPDFLDSWEKHVEEILNATNASVSNLARMGWFLPHPGKMLQREIVSVRSLRDKSDEEVDEFMGDFYGARLPDIETDVCRRFPIRRKVLKSAFDAHHNETYDLSIPVFLAQADGIFLELSGTEKGVYSRKRGTGDPSSKAFIDQMDLDDDYMASFLVPLCRPTALNYGKRERRRNPGFLNRHSVMHGVSTDYGTKINSLRAISFLFFIGTIIDEGP